MIAPTTPTTPTTPSTSTPSPAFTTLTARPAAAAAAASSRAERVRALLPSVVLDAAAPLCAYLLLRPRVGSDTEALAIGTAIPIAVTLALFAWRRRVDPVGAIAVVVFGMALAATVLTGANSLVLKLQDAVVTGPIGVACLVSVAVRRPFQLVVIRLLARRQPRLEPKLRDPDFFRDSMVVTALLGAMMTLHAAALLVLALTQSTSRFLELSRPVGWTVLGLGVVALVAFRNKARRKRDARSPESITR